MSMIRLFRTALLAVLLPSLAPAAPEGFGAGIRAALEQGRTAEAAALAQTVLAADPDDATAHAALGVARFLGAVEGLMQGFHRHGLHSGNPDHAGRGMAMMPFLRLPVPENPAPEPVSYAALRGLLSGFHDGLASAETALAAAGDRPVALELDLGRIRLDLDGDGRGESDEGLMRVMGAILFIGRPPQTMPVDMDSGDVAWLQAYAHLLMAMTDFLLAHDWEAAYDATFEGVFLASTVPPSALHAMTRRAPQIEAEAEAGLPPPPGCDRWSGTEAEQEACRAAFDTYEAHPALVAKRALDTYRGAVGIADVIGFVHLMRWPVVEPARTAEALGHLEQMVALSRETWARILAETDDSREWLPNPAQTGVIPNLRIDAARVEGWLGFLDHFEAVLKGEMLLPHWRFEQGLNFRRMMLEPRQFDLVMLLQGAAALPYLEDGPIADSATWARATEVFGGDFLVYFLWIN